MNCTFEFLEAIYDFLISPSTFYNGSTLDGTIIMYNKIVHRNLKTNPVNIDLKASIFQYATLKNLLLEGINRKTINTTIM